MGKRTGKHPLSECDRLLTAAMQRGEVVSNFRAQGGETWTCTCRRVFVHVCDEADGCYWTPAKDSRG